MEFKVKFKPEIEGLDEALGPVAKVMYKDKFEEAILSKAIAIWNAQTRISNKEGIAEFNRQWVAEHGENYDEAYDKAFNEYTEKLTDSISRLNPIRLLDGDYYVLLKGGTECITFMPPKEGEKYGIGTVRIKLEKVKK